MSLQPGYGGAIYVPVMAEWSVFYYFTFKVFLSQPPKTALKKMSAQLSQEQKEYGQTIEHVV